MVRLYENRVDEMENIKVTFPDGTTREYSRNTEFHTIALDYQENMDNDIIAIKVNNEVFSLDEKINNSEEVEFLDVTSLAGYKIYQSGLKYLFLRAASELYSDAQIHFLHSVPRGILCELIMPHNLTSDDVSRIKGKMASLVAQKERIYRYNMTVKDATRYYLSVNEPEKAENIQSIPNQVVTMYRFGKKINYFYTDMPYDTGVLNLFELVFLGRNRIVLVCPNVTSGSHVPEYVHYENIVTNFMGSKKWLRRMGSPYLSQMNNLVSSSKIKEFITSNEILYTEDLIRASDKIESLRNVKIVLIAGPSSSGKTTTTKRLSAILRSRGFEPIPLSTDDFFVDREDTPKNDAGEFDYECLQAIDLELFNSTLQKLLKGEEVQIPEYDFVNGRKEYNGNKVQLKENSLLLIEGLHCLNDELIPYIDNEYKFKIYLSPFIPLNIDRHNYISTLDLRLIRRIVRDNRTRGKNVAQTIGEWQLVRSGEEKYIFPYVYQADMIINTALAYEVGVLKVYASPLLYSVDILSPYYNEARRLIYYLQMFFPIPSEYVPDNSVLREFVGENK